MSQKIVLITGANGGVGPAVVKKFLAEGDRVIGVGRAVEGPEHPSYTGIAADLASPQEVHRAVDDAMKVSGRLDVLVHLVGSFVGGKGVPDTDDDTWNRMLNVNLNPAFYV